MKTARIGVAVKLSYCAETLVVLRFFHRFHQIFQGNSEIIPRLSHDCVQNPSLLRTCKANNVGFSLGLLSTYLRNK
jgi:hypothetical protein